MSPDELAAKVAADIVSWHESNCPFSEDPRLARYQYALALVCTLRAEMDDGETPVSIWALWQEREDEVIGLARMFQRLRASAKRALAEAEGHLTPRTEALLRESLQ